MADFDPSSVPSPDKLLGSGSHGYETIDDLNNRIKDAYLESGGEGYNGPDDYTGMAAQWGQQYQAQPKQPQIEMGNGNYADLFNYSAPQQMSPSLPENSYVGDNGTILSGEDQYNPAGTIYEDAVNQANKYPGYDWLGSGYFDEFAEEGGPSAREILERQRDTNELAVGDGGYLLDQGAYSDWLNSDENIFNKTAKIGGGGEALVDDGTNSWQNRTSPFITVEEAARAARFSGNDELLNYLNDLDLDSENGGKQILYKGDLVDLGYQPWIPDAGVAAIYQATDAAMAEDRFWKGVEDWRSDTTDWTVNYNNKQHSGKEVDEAINDALSQGFWYTTVDGERVPTRFFSQEKFNSGELKAKITAADPDNLHIVDTVSNNEWVFPGNEFPQMEFATPTLEDGTKIPVEDWGKVTRDPNILRYYTQLTKNFGGYGQEFLDAYDKDVAAAKNNPAINYDWGILPGWNAPRYAYDGLIENNGNWLPALADMALGSAAYFNPATMFTHGIADLALQGQGIDTNSIDYDEGRYTPLADWQANSIASPVALLAEGSLGSVGVSKAGEGILEQLAKLVPRKAAEAAPNRLTRSWAAQELIPQAVSEGLEEVVTDPLYEIAGSGANFYKNERTDEFGRSYSDDAYGRTQYVDTDPRQRLLNYAGSMPDSFLGGAALGGVMTGGGRVLGNLSAKAQGQITPGEIDAARNNFYLDQLRKGWKPTEQEVDAGIMRRSGGMSELPSYEDYLEELNNGSGLDPEVLDRFAERNILWT